MSQSRRCRAMPETAARPRNATAPARRARASQPPLRCRSSWRARLSCAPRGSSSCFCRVAVPVVMGTRWGDVIPAKVARPQAKGVDRPAAAFASACSHATRAAVLTPSGAPEPAPPGVTEAAPPDDAPPSRSRVRTARVLAVAADALQLFFFPLFGEGFASPINDVLDMGVALAL